MVLSLAVIGFRGCGGCELQVLRVFLLYPDLTRVYDLVYWPMVVEGNDARNMSIDVCLVCGVINGNEENMLKEYRSRCRVLIAIGCCAINGGIFTNRARRLGFNGLLIPPCSIIGFDYRIPGCPPPLPLVAGILRGLQRGALRPPKRGGILFAPLGKAAVMQRGTALPGTPSGQDSSTGSQLSSK